MSSPTQMRLGYVLSTSFDSLIPWKADYTLDGLEGTMEHHAAELWPGKLVRLLEATMRWFLV